MFFTSNFFWFIMGIISVLIAVSARAWAKDFGLKLSWWMWLISASWYCLLLLIVSLSFTFVGENEPKAGYKMLAFLGGFCVILGVVIFRIIWVKARIKSE